MSRSNVSCSFYCLTGSRPSIVWSSIHFREITVTCQSANGFLPRWQSVTLKYSEKPFERLGFIELLAVQTQLVDFYLQYWMHFGAFPCPRSFSRTPWVLGLLGLSVVSALISHLNRLLIVLAYVELAFSPCWGSVWWGRGKENLENGRGHRLRSAWGT